MLTAVVLVLLACIAFQAWRIKIYLAGVLSHQKLAIRNQVAISGQLDRAVSALDEQADQVR